MPIFTTPQVAPAQPRVSIQGSIAVELEWALGSASRADFRDDHPVLSAVYGADPALGQQIRDFWPADLSMSCGGFMELILLAHHGGVLFTLDPDELLSQVEEICARAPADLHNLALISESEEDRAAIVGRMVLLRRSRVRRRDYSELLRATWAAVGPPWESSGKPSVEAAIAERRALLARGADWMDVTRGDCDFGAVLQQAVGGMGANGEVTVVPAFFTHLGLLVDLPNLVVVGVRTDVNGALARDRTEALARRLKAISDPTRLALLDLVRARPRTVTEVATALDITQPTVSNHVKLLREAGLLADVKEGRRRNLVLKEDVVADLLSELQTALASSTSAP